MSVYNFENHAQHHHHHNHQEHLIPTNNHTPSLPSSNGAQIRYQVDNDFNNRAGISNVGYPSTHHMDMSVQLIRPTSKTALLVRHRRAMLEQLSCFLCKGYLIDATTIDECMDSFCKSCIVIHLRSHNNCPKCGTLVHETYPLSSIRSDKVLQDIVYKLVPGLYDDEMKRRRDFYKTMYGNSSSSSSDDEGSSGSFTNGLGSSLSSEQYGVISHPKPFYKPTDSIDLSIEPQTRGDSSAIYYDNKRQSIVTCFTGNSVAASSNSMFSTVDSQQFKTYLRCPAKLTALQLKKFVAAKFNICRDDTIHLLYLNESLKDDYSLIDVAYIYDWRGIEHMRLFYIIERDLSSSTNLLRNDQVGSQTRKTKPSQSTVGTSTQIVKRVSIDPHPKFYEETNNNKAVNSPQQSGRSMRPRPEIYVNRSLTTQTASQAPILRSYGGVSIAGGNSSVKESGLNGASSRELIALRADEARLQSQFTGPGTRDELSRVGHNIPIKETRSRAAVVAAANPIQKLNIGVNQSGQTSPLASPEKNSVNTYSKAKVEESPSQRLAPIVHQSSLRQMIPCVRRSPYSSVSSVASDAPQGSMVTLASFTEVRSNYVMTSSASSSNPSTSSSNSYKDSGSPSKSDQMKSAVTKSHQPNKTSLPQAAIPQLAFKIVTKSGVSYIRPRINEANEPVSSGSSGKPVTSTSSAQPSSSSGSTSTSTSTRSDQQARSNASQYNSNQSLHSGVSHSHVSGGQDGTSNVNSGSSSSSARHHMKVKPVYKTFVDPTKLKSPNLKRLGYTARH